MATTIDELESSPGLPPAAYLVVLDGVRKGAKLDLEECSYVVGSSEECDVMFNEPGIPEKYLELTVSKEQVVVTPMSSAPVTIDNETKIGIERIITKPSVISLGSISMLLSPIVPKAKSKQSGNNREAQSVGTSSMRWDTRLPFLVLGILATILLIAKVSSGISSNMDEKDFGQAEGSAMSQKGGDGQLSNRDNPSLSGQVRLDGSTTDGGLHDPERGQENLKNILNALGYSDFKIEMQPSGVVKLSGYVVSKNDWETHKPLIMQDVGWITELDDSGVETLMDRKERLAGNVFEEGLGSKVTVTVRSDNLVLLGALNKSQSRTLNQIIRTWNQTHQGKPEVKNRTRVAETEVRGLDVMAVSITDVSMVTLRDGSRYAEGAVLPGGYLLKDISIEKLTLSRNDEDLTLTLGSK